jgi:hypothetical protein
MKESKDGQIKIYFRETSERKSTTAETTGEDYPPERSEATEDRNRSGNPK